MTRAEVRQQAYAAIDAAAHARFQDEGYYEGPKGGFAEIHHDGLQSLGLWALVGLRRLALASEAEEEKYLKLAAIEFALWREGAPRA